MDPSTIGWISASVLVPIGAAIAVAIRKPKARGSVQTYPKAAQILMFLLGIVGLGVCVYLVLKAPGNTDAVKYWGAVVVAFALGAGAMIGAYFYATYSVTVDPCSVTVVHPFRGTRILTRHNIIRVEESYFKGVRCLDVTYRDRDKARKIRFDRARFDLKDFFGARA